MQFFGTEADLSGSDSLICAKEHMYTTVPLRTNSNREATPAAIMVIYLHAVASSEMGEQHASDLTGEGP